MYKCGKKGNFIVIVTVSLLEGELQLFSNEKINQRV